MVGANSPTRMFSFGCTTTRAAAAIRTRTKCFFQWRIAAGGEGKPQSACWRAHLSFSRQNSSGLERARSPLPPAARRAPCRALRTLRTGRLAAISAKRSRSLPMTVPPVIFGNRAKFARARRIAPDAARLALHSIGYAAQTRRLDAICDLCPPCREMCRFVCRQLDPVDGSRRDLTDIIVFLVPGHTWRACSRCAQPDPS